MTYRAIHQKINYKWGKATKCQKCKSLTAKKYEWSNKNHQYNFIRKEWWQLCTKCHHAYDKKKFGKPIIWNKGARKKRPELECEWCKQKFTQRRAGQVLCSRTCTGQRNGNFQKKLKCSSTSQKTA